jgi:hypothetical protein
MSSRLVTGPITTRAGRLIARLPSLKLTDGGRAALLVFGGRSTGVVCRDGLAVRDGAKSRLFRGKAPAAMAATPTRRMPPPRSARARWGTMRFGVGEPDDGISGA